MTAEAQLSAGWVNRLLPDKIYRVGALAYTRRALLTVFFWMLLGDLCLQLMEQLPASLVPLQLRWAQASDTLVGFLSGSLPAILGIALNPFVGMQSDRHRGPLGRRRPFLLWATPVVVIALVALGFSNQASAFLAELFHSQSLASVKLGWISACIVSFVVANTYIMQVYQFLFVDVIPIEVMGKFIGCYRAVGALGAFAFHRFLFGYAETRTTEIYALAALLYAVAFSLMIWKVKEGDYPPPPESSGRLSSLGNYGRNCFGHLYYWKIYSLSLLFWGATVPLWTFAVFYGTKPGDTALHYAPTLGLSLEAFGHIRGWCAIIAIPVFFLVGGFVDRFHPLRVVMAGLFLSSATFFICFFFARSEQTLLIGLLVNAVCLAIYLGAYLALMPRLLPLANYGQFFTANQIVGFSGVVLAPVLCGWLIQSFRDYRLVFAWSGFCTFLSFLMCIAVYRQWRRLGGDTSYHPPV